MEKQQIRKRSARLRGPSTRPAVMPSLVSNEKQRVAGSRPPAVVAAKAAPEEFVSRDALLEAPARRTIRIFASALRVLLRPIRRGPLVPATAALTLIVGAIAITVSGGPSIHGSAAPPLTLPPDPQIASLLASYAQPSEADKPVEAVQLPTPHILEALKTRSVTVGRGDTISSIAAAAGLSIETLISFNSVSDVRLLTVGTVLKVPSMNGTLYTVRPGDNLERIAVSN
ncbi:MAG TPA: LysM peptidoglycan-binding domain-containing protein, partial [Spirochaetia bacterium]|nr:LysM peptidoglycan-binding domain-containing protein [Spirochaetia bacterium]